MPTTRTRPSAAGIVVELPTSLFYVTSKRSEPWRAVDEPPARPKRSPVDWTATVIDLRDEVDVAE